MSAVKGYGPSDVLVTGGAGFLGSHLCDRLVKRGHRVHCLDNLHTGRESNVAPLAASGRFVLLRHDVTAPIPDRLPRFAAIYDLACPASPKHYQADPVRTAMTCALGAWNVLKRAERDGSRIFHASTSEVYGDPEVHPQPEHYSGNVNPVGPRACYDEGKRFAETLFTDFARTRDLTLRIARIFNTYGPRMQPDDGRVVSNFIVQALKGEDLTIYGDGNQTRSLCYVDDLIAGVEALMDARGPISGPVNLGNPTETTIGHLAEMVIAMVGSRSRLRLMPRPVDDPRRRRADISRARALLGWQPEVALAEGLARTIEFFERELSGQSAFPTGGDEARQLPARSGRMPKGRAGGAMAPGPGLLYAAGSRGGAA